MAAMPELVTPAPAVDSARCNDAAAAREIDWRGLGVAMRSAAPPVTAASYPATSGQTFSPDGHAEVR